MHVTEITHINTYTNRLNLLTYFKRFIFLVFVLYSVVLFIKSLFRFFLVTMTILKFLIVGSLPSLLESNNKHVLTASFHIQRSFSASVPTDELLRVFISTVHEKLDLPEHTPRQDLVRFL